MKLTADDLKFALLWYFCFKRNMLAVTECQFGDVVAMDEYKKIYECEVKITKHDLWNGEAKKSKHYIYSEPEKYSVCSIPNVFYMCVPRYLKDEALKWCEEVNGRYGVIEYRDHYAVCVIRRAKPLHKTDRSGFVRSLLRKTCTQYILQLQKKIAPA